MSDMHVRGLAILAILVVGAANYVSLAWGAAIQNLSTMAKVVTLVGLALVVFFMGDPSQGSFAAAGSVDSPTTLAGFGVALIAVLWSYDGWADATYIAGEVKNPERSVPRAIVGGFGVVVGVYLLLNAAYLYVLPLQEMAASDLVAADAASVVLGAAGAAVVAALVLLSTFGALNGAMMSGPRVLFALGQDGLFFRGLGAVHRKGKTPHVAVLVATTLAVAFVSVRTFEELAEAFILGLWPFYMLAVLAVFRLRRQRPELHRPYKTWGYPVVPILFLLVSTVMLLNSFYGDPPSALFSFGIIASGIPVYWVWKRRARVNSPPP